MLKCSICEKDFEYSRRKRTTKKVCRSCLVNRHRWHLKQCMVDYKGGKCQLCNYNSCLSALDFHHVDPSKKNFSFGSNHNFGAKKLKEELNKCICLCKNCHAEVEQAIHFQPWIKEQAPILNSIQIIHEKFVSPVPDISFSRTGWKSNHPKYKKV